MQYIVQLQNIDYCFQCRHIHQPATPCQLVIDTTADIGSHRGRCTNPLEPPLDKPVTRDFFVMQNLAWRPQNSFQFHHSGEIKAPLPCPIELPVVPFLGNIPDLKKQVFDKYKHIVVRGSQCCGKTRFYRELLTSWDQDFVKHHEIKRVLFITSRVAMCLSMMEALTELGCKHYKSDYENNLPGLQQESRLVIQLESLHKLGVGNKLAGAKFQLIVLDEVEDIASQFRSTTLAAIRPDVVEALQYHMEHALIVFAFDADLNDRALYFLHTFCGGKKEFVLVDKPTPQPSGYERIYYKHHMQVGFENELKACVERNQVIFCAVNIKAEVDQMLVQIQKWRPEWRLGTEILCYTGKSPNAIKKEILQYKKKWKQCRILLYTGIIGSGIDFDEKHFDIGFVLAGNMASTARQTGQMLNRVRYLSTKTVHCFFTATIPNHPRPVQFDDILQRLRETGLLQIRQAYHDAQGQLHPPERLVLNPENIYLGLFLRNEIEANESFNNFEEIFWSKVQAGGNIILPFMDCKTDYNTKAIKALKAHKKQVKQEQIKSIADAKSFTPDEIQKLDRTDCSPQIDKHFWHSFITLNPTSSRTKMVKLFHPQRARSQWWRLQDLAHGAVWVHLHVTKHAQNKSEFIIHNPHRVAVVTDVEKLLEIADVPIQRPPQSLVANTPPRVYDVFNRALRIDRDKVKLTPENIDWLQTNYTRLQDEFHLEQGMPEAFTYVVLIGILRSILRQTFGMGLAESGGRVKKHQITCGNWEILYNPLAIPRSDRNRN